MLRIISKPEKVKNKGVEICIFRMARSRRITILFSLGQFHFASTWWAAGIA
jgi:hypothetical protein